MPLPLAPIAGLAIRYGAVAIATYAVSRRLGRGIVAGRTDQRAEDALDDLAEGIGTHHPKDRDQRNVAARFRRIYRFRADGPGIEIDAAGIVRFRLRKV